MKKKIVFILLFTLLLSSVTACSQPDNDMSETSESTQESTNYSAEETTESTSNPEQSSSEESDENSAWSKYQERVGCYVTTESGHNLSDLISKRASDITVEHEDYGSDTFHITTHRNNSEYKTTITLENGVRTPDIYGGFTSDTDGYIIIFHMEGYSISPMDDIELACVLKTHDGGKSWNKTEFHDFPVANGREYITSACFFSDDIGFFTARYYYSDHFGPRTFWTLDGGQTWTSMPELEIPNILEPFGLPHDFSSEITDLTVSDGVYTLTVRICNGYSFELDGEPFDVDGLYIQFSSTDLVNWELKKG